MKTTEDMMFDGILLKDVPMPEKEDEPTDERFDRASVFVSLIAPFVITIPASWFLGDNAAVVWWTSVFCGLYFLIRRLPPTPAAIALLLYVPVMFAGLLLVM